MNTKHLIIAALISCTLNTQLLSWPWTRRVTPVQTAQSEASLIIENAKLKAAAIIEAADVKADKIVEDARHHAEKIKVHGPSAGDKIKKWWNTRKQRAETNRY